MSISSDILWSTRSAGSDRLNAEWYTQLIHDNVRTIDLYFEGPASLGVPSVSLLSHMGTRSRGGCLHVVQFEIQLTTRHILKGKPILNVKIRMAVGIYDTEVTWLEHCSYPISESLSVMASRDLTSVLYFDIEKDKMPQFNRMDRHDAPFS